MKFKLKEEYYQTIDNLFHSDKANYYKTVKMDADEWIDCGFPLDKIEKTEYSHHYLEEFERLLRDLSISRASLIVEFKKIVSK